MTTLPHHPEPHTYTWTKLELESIAAYGKQCAEAERTRILGILADVAQAFGKPGECVFISVRARAEKI